MMAQHITVDTHRWALTVGPTGDLSRPQPLRVVSSKELVQPFDDVVETANRFAHKLFGTSLMAVAVRGSVARGTAVHGVSDCDLILVLERPATDREARHLLRLRSVSDVRIDLVAVDSDTLGEGGRRAALGGLISLDGLWIDRPGPPTARAVLGVTIDPIGRLGEVLHRWSTRGEVWPEGRAAWRVLRAAAQVQARTTGRFPLDLDPTVSELSTTSGPLGIDEILRLADAVRKGSVGDARWLLDPALRLMSAQETIS